MPRAHLLCLLCLAACPNPAAAPDAAVEADAGAPVEVDAGPRAHFDAGVDAGVGPVPIERWCATRAQVECARQVRCDQLSAVRAPECEALHQAGCDAVSLAGAVHAGRLQYLGAAATACLDAYGGGACAGTPGACDGVFTGLVPPDGGCALEAECDPAGFCFLGDQVCPHRCLPWAAPGGRCDGWRARCDPGSQTCGAGDAGVMVCGPQQQLGEACPRYDSCAPGLLCLGGQCVRREAALGETCGQVSGYPLCAPELACRQDLTQAPLPPGTCQRRAGLGGACTGNADCLPSLRCTTVVTTGTCEARATLDEACAAWDDCEEGLFCAAARGGRCTRFPSDGGDCSSQGSGFRCDAHAYCDTTAAGSRCLPRHLAGQACTWAGQCLEGDCLPGAWPDGGQGARCLPPCGQRWDGGLAP